MELTMDSASVHNFPHSQTAIRGINYDSSTNKLYWFYKNGIYYANFYNLTENRLLAMISDVKSINVIPHEPIIIVCTGSQIFSIWKTGGYYRQ
uniref:Olfactomedin-like domain-containing protein n=1 Tax=Romanomermis culicivorax TaxID=13658 RepID=A0A915HDZ8_ROMCU